MADGDFPHVLPHVHEASIDHPLSVQVRHIQPLAHRGTGPVDFADPLLAPRRLVDGVVVAVEPALMLLHLHPPARLQIAERFTVELRPVGDAAAQGSPVDEIERLPELPRGLGVIDVEVAVGRHPDGLDGGEIRADDYGGGEFIRNLDGPDSGPGADVQDPLRWGSGDGSCVQASV